MKNESTFDFLKEDSQFDFVYNNYLQSMELDITHGLYNPSIANARVISETLLKIIIRNEFPELREELLTKDTSVDKTFSKLINDVYYKRLINFNIKEKYHEMREMGNPVIHPDLYEPVEYTLDDSLRARKVIFDLALDCFKRYNLAYKIEYVPISSSLGKGPKINMDLLFRDIDFSGYSDYIINYCKENILNEFIKGKITENDVKSRFNYYASLKNKEAQNLIIHSDLYYNPSEPKIEDYITKEEKLDVYEKVKDVICKGFDGSVYDLLVEEMTKIVETNQIQAKNEFEKYYNKLSDLTNLTDEESENYIKLILSLIENNEIKTEDITEIFITKTGNEYHSDGKINMIYIRYAINLVDDLYNSVDLTQYDAVLLDKCKNNLLRGLFERKIMENSIKSRFEYCVSRKERERQNLLEFMSLYHNPAEPSEELFLTREEKDEVYKKVENIIRDDFSGSVRDLIVNEINSVLEENKNKARNEFENHIDSLTELTEHTGLTESEIDDYIEQILLFIENYDLKAEHITETFIVNTTKEFHSKGSINKRRMMYHVLNEESAGDLIEYDDVSDVSGSGDDLIESDEETIALEDVDGFDEEVPVSSSDNLEEDIIVDEDSDDDLDDFGGGSLVLDSDDEPDVSIEDSQEDQNEPLSIGDILESIPLFKKENRFDLLSITGLTDDEANEYIEEIISIIGEEISIEEITEEFIRETGTDYHLFGIIDI